MSGRPEASERRVGKRGRAPAQEVVPGRQDWLSGTADGPLTMLTNRAENAEVARGGQIGGHALRQPPERDGASEGAARQAMTPLRQAGCGRGRTAPGSRIRACGRVRERARARAGMWQLNRLGSANGDQATAPHSRTRRRITIRAQPREREPLRRLATPGRPAWLDGSLRSRRKLLTCKLFASRYKEIRGMSWM